ncbi:MAG: hypothetical protein QM689_10925 [Oscillospiraceae bacterium]
MKSQNRQQSIFLSICKKAENILRAAGCSYFQKNHRVRFAEKCPASAFKPERGTERLST